MASTPEPDRVSECGGDAVLGRLPGIAGRSVGWAGTPLRSASLSEPRDAFRNHGEFMARIPADSFARKRAEVSALEGMRRPPARDHVAATSAAPFALVAGFLSRFRIPLNAVVTHHR